MGEVEGAERFKRMVGSFYVGLRDLSVELDQLVAEDDFVAARYTVTGTHQGELFGVPGTSKGVSYGGQPSYRVADGRIVEVWFYEDDLGLMQQIGAMPSGEEADA